MTRSTVSNEKPLIWIASSKADLDGMPDKVQDTFGHALGLAQMGLTYEGAKLLKGFNANRVYQISDNAEGNTHRAVYTVQYPEAVYVLDCFEKKSTDGIKTPQHIIDRIKDRLKHVSTLRQRKGLS
jgi:phage-related protein